MSKIKPKPTVVNIFGKTYAIKYEDLSKAHVYGLVDNKNALIMIDKTLVGYELQQTLIHEYLHAVFDRTSLTQSIPDELEEVIVDQVATFLVDMYNFDL